MSGIAVFSARCDSLNPAQATRKVPPRMSNFLLSALGVVCPSCDEYNEPGSQKCASCGDAIGIAQAGVPAAPPAAAATPPAAAKSRTATAQQQPAAPAPAALGDDEPATSSFGV